MSKLLNTIARFLGLKEEYGAAQVFLRQNVQPVVHVGSRIIPISGNWANGNVTGTGYKSVFTTPSDKKYRLICGYLDDGTGNFTINGLGVTLDSEQVLYWSGTAGNTVWIQNSSLPDAWIPPNTTIVSNVVAFTGAGTPKYAFIVEEMPA